MDLTLFFFGQLFVCSSIVFHVWGPGHSAAISRILLAGCYKRFVSRSPSYIFHSPSLLILQKKKSRVCLVLFLFYFIFLFSYYTASARAHVTAATLLLFYRNEKEKEKKTFSFVFEIFFSPFLLPN
jgi:hypothetical protein